LDEVHKYPNWSQELKNAYDDYPDLKIVFTGSSLLEILNARADLSRRAVMYRMQGLSFREYLNMTLTAGFRTFRLEEILSEQRNISSEILKNIKPLQHFNTYLERGYYPFSFEMKELYYSQLEEVIDLILEIELPLLRGVDISYIPKLKQLLLIIAESAPFVPNVSKLSERIGINRSTLVSYLYFLQETNLTKHLYKNSSGISKLQKPDKIFLENTNLAFLLAENNANKGNLRETFFFNQMSYSHNTEYAENGDFFVNKKYNFEIGGKNKTDRQIQNMENAFVVADDIEYGYNNKIPLWMFGFLY
jgi:predicted AAA+ superfamily ATPase